MPAEDILHGRRGEEVLLPEAELFALIGAVIWIEHTGNILNIVLFAHGKGVFLRIERREVEFLNSFALP